MKTPHTHVCPSIHNSNFSTEYGTPKVCPGDPIILLQRILARWVNTVLHISGVDIDIYKPHSYRSTSPSHAKHPGIPLEDILMESLL